MKKKSAVSVAGVLAFLYAAVAANAYVYEGFESAGGNGANPWPGDSRVIVTNEGAIKHGSFSLYIPTLATVTNIPVSTVTDRKVWTDFYTVPRPFVSDSGTAPAVDTNATAQFFVNSNGMWVTISGAGTNVCTNSFLSNVNYPTVTQYSAFYHVSVLHDYSNFVWSLFVDGAPIATNLSFLASGVATHSWFQVQNLGGNNSNVCWLDDFLVTNRMVTTGTGNNTITNVVPGTTIPVADALAGFGSMSDPRPTNEVVGTVGATVTLAFGGGANNGRFIVLGTSQSSLSGLSSNGVLDAEGNFSADLASFNGDRKYYKIVTVSDDNLIAVTNDETYAAFKQYTDRNKYYVIGANVIYQNPTNRTMAGAMGMQLKYGLGLDDLITIITNGVNLCTYRLEGVAPYSWNGTGDELGTNQWAQGVGMLLKRSSLGVASASYYFGIKETNAISVAVKNDTWSYLSWPYNATNFSGDGSSVLGFTPSENDYIYIQTNGNANFIPARFKDFVWKKGANTNLLGSAISLTLQPGDGIIYKSKGGDRVFSSVGP
jgi:hypothetical protein